MAWRIAARYIPRRFSSNARNLYVEGKAIDHSLPSINQTTAKSSTTINPWLNQWQPKSDQFSRQEFNHLEKRVNRVEERTHGIEKSMVMDNEESSRCFHKLDSDFAEGFKRVNALVEKLVKEVNVISEDLTVFYFQVKERDDRLRDMLHESLPKVDRLANEVETLREERQFLWDDFVKVESRMNQGLSEVEDRMNQVEERMKEIEKQVNKSKTMGEELRNIEKLFNEEVQGDKTVDEAFEEAMKEENIAEFLEKAKKFNELMDKVIEQSQLIVHKAVKEVGETGEDVTKLRFDDVGYPEETVQEEKEKENRRIEDVKESGRIEKAVKEAEERIMKQVEEKVAKKYRPCRYLMYGAGVYAAVHLLDHII